MPETDFSHAQPEYLPPQSRAGTEARTGFSIGSGQGRRQVGQPSRPRATATNALILINVLVFAVMVLNGVPFMSPTGRDLLPWGADMGPLTVGAGEWWRLLTACFLHFGILHIAMNMYVLYQIGPFTEMVFGRLRYLLLYVAAGLAGNLLSLAVHPMGTAAGASGAIFGLYGGVFAFLLAERASLDPQAVRSIGRSAGLFVLFNVFYGGAVRGTDLAAHGGGLVGGFLFGLLLVRQRAGGPRRAPLAVTVVVIAAALGVGGYALARRQGTNREKGLFVEQLVTDRTYALPNGQLFYAKSVSDADARTVGEALKGTALNQAQELGVLLDRRNGALTVSIPVDGPGEGKPALWDEPEAVAVYAQIAAAVQQALGGQRVQVILLDQDGAAHRTITPADGPGPALPKN